MNVTIITGTSKGIGKAIFDDLSLLPELKVFGYEGRKTIDFTDFISVYYKTDRLLGSLNPLGLDQLNLVLCAASIGRPGAIDLRDFSELYRINVLGNLAVIKAAMNFNFEKVRIVWFAGGGAAYPFPEFPAYSASKVAVVRTVENLSIILKTRYDDVSIIALAPGAVDTDMLKQVEAAKCEIRTRTDISESVTFVRNFITDQFNSQLLNGKFLHVRDNLNLTMQSPQYFTLRRIE